MLSSSPEVCSTVCPHNELNLTEFSLRSFFTPQCFDRPRLPDRAGPLFLRLVVTSFLLMLLPAVADVSVAMAQSPTATLTGTVTDQNDAVIPGVNIAVISIAQGFQRTAVTDGDGAY